MCIRDSLKLHSNDLESASDKRVFRDVTNKILAMSLVHQKLYESRNLSQISASDYLQEVFSLLKKSHVLPEESIEIAYQIEDINILIDTAVPLGLAISEIASNSLKYAFPDGRKGTIQVELREVEDFIELKIRDDGIGLPAQFQPTRDGRMGMKTLFTLVEHQLRGSIELQTESGVGYTIRFKNELHHERVSVHG